MKLFAFLNIKWLLHLIYRISKNFGFVFISIDFTSLETIAMSVKHSDRLWSIISIGYSLYALTYDGRLPLATFTQSIIMEIGINAMTRVTLFTTFLIKTTTLINGRKFFDILNGVKWCHLEVRRSTLLGSSQKSYYLSSFKGTTFSR